jgi:hypothetical protein
MQGRLKDVYYTKEVLARELCIARETLNSLIKEEKNLANCLLTGLVLKLESSAKENLPLDEISNYFKNEQIKISELINLEDINKFSFLRNKNIVDTIDFGFAYISHYKITYTQLNKFIEERNLFRHKVEKLKEEYSIYSKITKEEEL